MICNSRLRLVAASAMIFAGLPAYAEASFEKSKDWPCIQREMPQISAGMVWTGDPVDPEDRSWTRQPKVASIVQEVTSRRKTIDEAIEVIETFAASLTQNRSEQLRAVFVGAFQRINAERRKVMGGIKRYARRQSALADQIKEKSLKEAHLSRQESQSDEEKQNLSELSEEIGWDTRVYEEREHSLTYVCESAVLLEQRLFQIGRHISELIKK